MELESELEWVWGSALDWERCRFLPRMALHPRGVVRCDDEEVFGSRVEIGDRDARCAGDIQSVRIRVARGSVVEIIAGDIWLGVWVPARRCAVCTGDRPGKKEE